MLEILQYDIRAYAKINQACHFVDVVNPELVDHFEAAFRCAEQSAGLKVPIKRMRQQRFHILLRQLAKVNFFRLFPLGLEGRKSPSIFLNEVGGSPQIIDERFANRFSHELRTVTDESMEHQGDTPAPGMARIAPGLAIERHLFRHFFDALTKQVREHVRACPARHLVGLRIAGRRHPDGKLRLNRSRQYPNGHLRSYWSRESDRLAAPQFPHNLNVVKHGLLPAREILRLKHEILRHPTRSE